MRVCIKISMLNGGNVNRVLYCMITRRAKIIQIQTGDVVAPE